MLAYRLLQAFLRFVISVFFRNIEVVGKENIPTEGGIIFAGNHPNSLVDPLLVITQSGRIVHVAARDALFQSRFLRFFLKTLGAVPIKRRMDHEGKDVDNQSAFDALSDVLLQGGCMGIFPEGISHTDSELSRLKTGTARLAFGVLEKKPDAKISIVPVGLTYLHRQRFRSQALVHFGPPIAVDRAWVERYKEESKAAVTEMTEELEQRLRSLTVNTPDWDTMRLMHTARRLYKPDKAHLSLKDYTELTRRFAEGFLKNLHEPMIQALRQELEEYQERLDVLQLRDHDLRRDPPMRQILVRLLGRCVYLVFLLPLALPGMLLHLPVWSTAIIAGDGLTSRKDVVATTKLIASILTVPLLYLVVALGIGWFAGLTTALIIGFLLPFTGFATIRVLEQQIAIGRSFRAVLRLLHFREEVRDLFARRQALSSKIDKAVDVYHDPSVPRIFSKSADAPKEA